MFITKPTFTHCSPRVKPTPGLYDSYCASTRISRMFCDYYCDLLAPFHTFNPAFRRISRDNPAAEQGQQALEANVGVSPLWNVPG